MSAKIVKTVKRDTKSKDEKYLGYLRVYADNKDNLEVKEPVKVVKVKVVKAKTTKAKAAKTTKAAQKGTSSPRGRKKGFSSLSDRYKEAKAQKKYISVNKLSSTIGRGEAGREFEVASMAIVAGSDRATKNKFIPGIYLAAESAGLFGRAIDRLVDEKTLTDKQAEAAKDKFQKKYAKKVVVKKTVAKKSPGRNAPAKKSPGRKAPAKKSPGRKAPAKKSPGRKAPAKKSPARKSPARKSPARRSRSSSASRASDLPDISPPGSPVSQAPLPSIDSLGRGTPSPSRLVGGLPPVTRSRGRASPSRSRVSPSRVTVSPRARSRSPVLGSGSAPPLQIPQ